jgi:hypothetical protein
MSVTWYVDERRRLRILHFAADTTLAEMEALIRRVAEKREDFATFDEVSLFADVRSVLRSGGPEEFALLMAEHYGARPQVRDVLVAQSEVDFGLLRRYAAYRGADDTRVRVFRSAADALRWVDVPEPDLPKLLEICDRLTRGERP